MRLVNSFMIYSLSESAIVVMKPTQDPKWANSILLQSVISLGLQVHYKRSTTNENIIIIMKISTAPYLLKMLQPKARTKAIQTTITSHRHTHAHTHTHQHTHTHSHTRHHLRITCHWSFICTLSLPTRSHTGAGHMQFNRRKSRVSSWTHREVLRVWFVHWAE